MGAFQLDVSFRTDGQVLALLGASGCGKSVTLRCIAGVERPDSGRIELNGRVLFDGEKGIDLTPQERRVGLLFQNYALFPQMTVEQNIAAGACRLPVQKRRAAVEETVRRFQLTGLEKRRPGQLSGGQQQRVALARILVGEPEVLLLDEPFSALDSYLKWQLELELLETLESFSGDVVYVSHDRDEVCHMCDTVCVLTEGRSELQGPVRQLMESPSTVGAALLSGCKNYSRVTRLDDHTLRCEDWDVTLRTDAAAGPETTTAGVRAHHILPGEAAENSFPCRVERVIRGPFSTVVMLHSPGSGLLRMELEGDRWIGLGEPEEVTVHVPPEQVMPLTGGNTCRI
jgi:molybdate transport system ATP-binding protein